MVIHKLLSVLLDYPDADLRANLAGMRGVVEADKILSPDERQGLKKFLDWAGSLELTELQAVYVQTFDLAPEHSLHLTHHLFGDDKGRGPALIDLVEYYQGFELKPAEGELPDFLPLMLEFVSTLAENEARIFLADAAKVLAVLAANLEKAGSPYAPLVRIIENHGRLARVAA